MEDRIAVYTDELAEIYKQKKGRSLTTDAIKKTYLEELKNNGLIDEFKSTVDKRKNTPSIEYENIIIYLNDIFI